MAFGQATNDPPPVWITRRGESLFYLPTEVDLQDQNHVWQPNSSALVALSKNWSPGQEQDARNVGVPMRVTFPFSGPCVLLGRARGDLSTLRIDGALAYATWLGLDAGHSPGWPAKFPRGWHPWQARVYGGPSFILTGTNLKLSLLVARLTTPPTPPDGGGGGGSS
ncbi:hypothetical protein [Deinococcus ruber]|uniref:Uncharacterized protein n=1 Tax=Deinococcus ruber TaxID=1848197 RepID=A0A918C846_9DEIO|nr:hypothetical protein [Deinococcus ruber]GGR11354.1 hypothetical protein GCM10008957_25110 [Deinococcus ruber]